MKHVHNTTYMHVTRTNLYTIMAGIYTMYFTTAHRDGHSVRVHLVQPMDFHRVQDPYDNV